MAENPLSFCSFFFSPLEWFLLLVGLFILSYVHQKLTNKGPTLWPLIGMMPSLVSHINEIYDWVTVELIRSGGTFHYRGLSCSGAFGIVTANPCNIEYILKTHFKNFPKGNYYRERFHDFLGDGIFNCDDELWKEQRKIAVSEMHSSDFLSHSYRATSDLVHHKLLKLIDKWVSYGDHVIDLQEVLLRFTFDNICTAAFGMDPGCLALELPEIPFPKAFEGATEMSMSRFLVPPFVWKLMRLFNIGNEKRLRNAVSVVTDFADKMVRDRRVEFNKLLNLDDRNDLLSGFIQKTYHDEETGKRKFRFSNKFLRDFCMSFILAGRDTSSVALAWFFWLIHKNPEAENKILNELDEILSHRNSNMRNINSVVFASEELKKMVYLQAALSESLRLYPSVPVDFKIALTDDVLPDGHVVKKNARVIYSIYSMARMESIWGKDCLEFKPQRWIENGNFVSENQFKFVVFNGGPRVCLGKKFAYMQMKMVAASILLRYSVKVVEGQHIIPKLTTTLYMKNGLLVTFLPRP